MFHISMSSRRRSDTFTCRTDIAVICHCSTGLASNRMLSPLWILLARGGGGGEDNWSYKMRKTPVKSSPATNQTPSFFTCRMLFLSPNQQCQSTEGKLA